MTTLDIAHLQPQTSISRNFKYYEVIRSSQASRSGIDNNIKDQAVLNRVVNLAENILEPIREVLGPISPNSWYRGEELEKVTTYKSYLVWRDKQNRARLPSEWSDYLAKKSHPRGSAVDIEIPGIYNDYLFNWIKTSLEYDQLIREFPVKGDPMSGWVHVSYERGKNRKQAFTIG